VHRLSEGNSGTWMKPWLAQKTARASSLPLRHPNRTLRQFCGFPQTLDQIRSRPRAPTSSFANARTFARKYPGARSELLTCNLWLDLRQPKRKGLRRPSGFPDPYMTVWLKRRLAETSQQICW